jgi:hypothetical protein
VSTDVLLPLAIFFILGLPILLLVWRVFFVGGQLRREAQRGRAAIDLARRVDSSLAELSTAVDELRQRRAGPEVIEASLRASAQALPRFLLEAATLDKQIGPAEQGGLRVEIERAQRAVELIEHGRELMLTTRDGRMGEGETAVKRGYLNLVHAREAVWARANEIAAAATAPRTADPSWRGRNR